MATRKLARMGLPSEYEAAVQRAGVSTAAELLTCSELHLIHKLDLPRSDVLALLALVGKAVTGAPKSAWSLLQQRQEEGGEIQQEVEPSQAQQQQKHKAASCLALVPERSGTQLVPGLISELVGAAGSGKTQACLTAAVRACVGEEYGGLGGGVVYFNTERAFSSSRFLQIAEERFPLACDSPAKIQQLLARVTLFDDDTCTSILRSLKQSSELETHIMEHNVKLIVVDSIAAPARAEFDQQSQLGARQQMLGQISNALKYLAETFRLAVLVTNRAGSKARSASAAVSAAVASSVTDAALVQELAMATASSASAILGVGWAHAVNTRFVFVEGGVLYIEKSPVVAAEVIDVKIDAGGLRLA